MGTAKMRLGRPSTVELIRFIAHENRLRAALVALCLVGCVVAALWPFTFARPMSWNRAVPGASGGVAFPAPGIARTNGPPPSMGEAMGSGRLEVRVEARPFTLDQQGPARILSLSWDPFHRNLTLGQEGDALVLRLRTPATTDNGTPELRVAGVFSPARWTTVRVSINPGKLALDISPAWRLERPLPVAPLSVWDPGYPIVLGNERSGNRPWLGEIRHAVVETAAGAIDYAAPSAHIRPRILWHFHNGLRLNPLAGTSPFDAALNLVGFIPLGFALGFGRRPWRAVGAIGFAFTTSAALETAQLFVPGRLPSTADLLFNTLGAACGWLLARRLGRRLPAESAFAATSSRASGAAPSHVRSASERTGSDGSGQERRRRRTYDGRRPDLSCFHRTNR